MALSECAIIIDLYDRELTEHAESPFPIACYADNLSIQDVAWHWHDVWEIAIVTEGEAEFFVESTHFTLKKGEGIFINSRALHAVKQCQAAPCMLHSITFHPRLVGGSTDSVFWQNLVKPLNENMNTRFLLLYPDSDWQNLVLDHFHHAWSAVADECDDFENITRYELSAGMRCMLQHTDFDASGLSEQQLLSARRMRTMLEYLEDHYREDITVSDLSGLINASDSVCLRTFHELIGTTPIQYLRQLRLKKAAAMLLSTEKTAKEAALTCGFNDVSYFNRSFRQQFGCTPKEYRAAKSAHHT